MTSAIVVGSGPNGLAAATVLSRAGVEVTVLEANQQIGGGARSVNSPVSELLQDHCAAVHPMAPGSAFFQSLDLPAMGVEWGYAPIDAAHPFDDGEAALLYTSVDQTSKSLGVDGNAWRRMFKSSSLNFAKLQTSMMAPLLRIPKHPLLLARFGLVAGPAPTLVMRAFKTEKAKALFMGVAAHAIQPLNQPLITGIGAGIITAGHAVGWPVIKGGTGKFTNALVALLESLGVKFETGVRVTDLKQLPPHDILMLDMHPVNAAKLLESTQPKRYSRAFTNFKPGPAAFKVDYAVEGGVPWRDENVAKAGTVHLGGTAKEIIASERAIALGKMPDKPFVLVGQQYIADPARSNNNLHPVYAYAHVPHGFEGDATEAITAQIERFAPGFRERIIASSARSTFQTEQENANFIGGDILTGAKSTLQFMFGPRIGLHPYDTGVPGVYICSAATPPGPGIHGMSGYNAALRAIAKMKR